LQTYFFLERIYKDLEISQLLINYGSKSKQKNDLNSILKLLVFIRILSPISKNATFESQAEYFESFEVTLNSIYSDLSSDIRLGRYHSFISAFCFCLSTF
jgi:hypothetical protein